MTEQEISKIVSAVLEEKKRNASPHEHAHVCTCKQHKMTLEKANALIEKVKEKATEMGIQIVAAVADSSGRPIAIQCMDGAYIASFDVALNKAFTSASLKMSTETLSHLSQPGQSLYGIQFTNQGKIVIFGGGEPLAADGKIVGALGVSGGSAEQDTQIAAYGKKVFEEVMTCL